MTPFHPFALERWQSTHENDVEYNLSESGVHPFTIRELRALGEDADLDDVLLGYGQTNGTLALRTRIAELYPGATPDHVTVANGSAEANFAALWALCDERAPIAVVVPTYLQTPGIAAAFGAPVIEIPLREELGWQPDPDEVARLTREGVAAIVITNPCNPTGSVLSEEARRALMDAAAAADAWIVADEVYAGAELSGERTQSFFGAYPRTIATGSLSKAYGLPGLRIGWAVSTPAMTEQLWARRDYSTIAPATPSDHLATLALEPLVRERILHRTRTLIAQGLEILEPWLHERGIFQWQKPAAGAICLARCAAPFDAIAFSERLRTEKSVLLVPGDHFGVPHALRFGVGSPETLAAALARTAASLAALPVNAAATG